MRVFLRNAVLLAVIAIGALAGCGEGAPTGPRTLRPETPEWPGVALNGVPRSLLTPAPESALTAEQALWVSRIRQRSTTLDAQVTRLSPAADEILASGAPIIIDASPLLRISVVRTRFERRPDGNLSWSGEVHERYGSVTAVLHAGNFLASVHTQREAYSIEPIGGGAYVVSRVGNFPPD